MPHTPQDRYSPGMEHWIRNYILNVLEKKDWSPNRLASEAKLSTSTIARPLREKDWKFDMKPSTIRKIQKASGIDPTPYMPNELRENAVLYTTTDKLDAPLDLNRIVISVSEDIATIDARVDAKGLARLREKLDALATIL